MAGARIDYTQICRFCGKSESHDVPVDGLEKWQDGMRIQDAMPKEELFLREFLITGVCYECQSKLYNRPMPGEDWGEMLGECENCGAPIYPKDMGVCPSCGEDLNVSEEE